MKYENFYPIHATMILENANFITWSSKSMELNTTLLWIDTSWFFLFNQILKHDLYYLNTWIVEQTAIDQLLNNKFITNTSRLVLLNIYYIYLAKTRLILLTNNNDYSFSIDSIFKNCNWLEREISEMYGLKFLFKTDSRKLLLDYSKIEHPMLKDNPSEGFKDVFYDILDNQISYVNNETTEL